MNDKVKINWGEIEEGQNVRVGNIGVDGGTVKIGDSVIDNQLEVFTANGDGGYPVFAKKINNRRCLVIDFDLIDYGSGKIFYNQELLPNKEENFKDGIKGEAYRLCPECNGSIINKQSCVGKVILTCVNNHETIYEIEEFVAYH